MMIEYALKISSWGISDTQSNMTKMSRAQMRFVDWWMYHVSLMELNMVSEWEILESGSIQHEKMKMDIRKHRFKRRVEILQIK